MYQKGRECGGGTEQGVYTFFRELIRDKKPVDNIIVFSDMVIGENNRWYGLHSSGDHSGSFQKMFSEFRKLYPRIKVVSVDIHQTSGTTVFNKNLNVTQIAEEIEKIVI